MGESGADKKDVVSEEAEEHRFLIALALIIGLILVMGAPLVYREYDSAKDLAAIFSGWIGSIVAFYFLGQSTQRAQDQVRQATKEGADARREATQAARKTVQLASECESVAREHESTRQELLEELEKYKKLAKELLDELDRLGGD